MRRVLATRIHDCEFVAFATKKTIVACLEEVVVELQFKTDAILTTSYCVCACLMSLDVASDFPHTACVMGLIFPPSLNSQST